MPDDAKRFPVVVALQADALPIGLPDQTYAIRVAAGLCHQMTQPKPSSNLEGR
jgi:hypothetical protein